MSKQLQINFTAFEPAMFERIKQSYLAQELESLKQQITHLNHVIGGYKAGKTRKEKSK